MIPETGETQQIIQKKFGYLSWFRAFIDERFFSKVKRSKHIQSEVVNSDEEPEFETERAINKEAVYEKIHAVIKLVYASHSNGSPWNDEVRSIRRPEVTNLSNCGVTTTEYCYSAYVFPIYQAITKSSPVSSADGNRLYGWRIALIRIPQESSGVGNDPQSNMKAALSLSDLPERGSCMEITLAKHSIGDSTTLHIDEIKIIDKAGCHWVDADQQLLITAEAPNWQKQYSQRKSKPATTAAMHTIKPTRLGHEIKMSTNEREHVYKILQEVYLALQGVV